MGKLQNDSKFTAVYFYTGGHGLSFIVIELNHFTIFCKYAYSIE